LSVHPTILPRQRYTCARKTVATWPTSESQFQAT